MPRRARLSLPNVPLHIIQRGNNRPADQSSLTPLIEDYKWTSYRANAHGAEDGLIQNHAEYLALGTTSEARQEAYRALFRTQMEPEALTELRASLNQELVTGSERFKGEIEAMLSRRVRPGKRGRPAKGYMSVEETNEQLF